MTTQVQAVAVAKRKRNDVPVKLDAEVVRVAKIVAAYRDQTLAEYLSERLRPLVTADHAEEIRQAGTEAPAADFATGADEDEPRPPRAKKKS